MDNSDTLRPEPLPSSLRPGPMRAGVLGSFRGGSGAAQPPTREAPLGGPVSEASERGAESDEQTSPGTFVPWDELELEQAGRCWAGCDGWEDDEP